MAKKEILKPFIRAWEGGFAIVKGDRGGATKWGVTLATFRAAFGQQKTVNDLKAMTEEQWDWIFKTMFWDKWKADHIDSQSVANLLVDWYWNSGKHGIRIPQRILGVKADGIVGQQTIAAVNSFHGEDRQELFAALWKARQAFYRSIDSSPSQRRFLKGHLNRLAAIRFKELEYNGKVEIIKE